MKKKKTPWAISICIGIILVGVIIFALIEGKYEQNKDMACDLAKKQIQYSTERTSMFFPYISASDLNFSNECKVIYLGFKVYYIRDSHMIASISMPYSMTLYDNGYLGKVLSFKYFN